MKQQATEALGRLVMGGRGWWGWYMKQQATEALGRLVMGGEGGGVGVDVEIWGTFG